MKVRFLVDKLMLEVMCLVNLGVTCIVRTLLGEKDEDEE